MKKDKYIKEEICIAIDYGGTKMMVAAVDKGGNILVLNTYRNMVPVTMNKKK